MTYDNDLKFTHHNAVLNAVMRIESESDQDIIRCIFHEYKEWLGTSINYLILAFHNDWRQSDVNLY